MKGGFYFAILLAASICDVIVTHVLVSENKRDIYDVNTRSDEISESEEELSDSEVNNELNLIGIDKEIIRDDYDVLGGASTEDVSDINEEFNSKEAETLINQDIFGEYVKDDIDNEIFEEENQDYQTLLSADDFNYSYDEVLKEFETRNNDHAISNEDVTNPTRSSHDKEAEGIFSSEEDEDWISKQERGRTSKDKRGQVIEKENNPVSDQVKGGASTDTKSSIIEEQDGQEKRSGEDGEKGVHIKDRKRGRGRKQENVKVHEKERNQLNKEEDCIGNELHATDHEKITNPLNSTTFITVNHYFCKTEDIAEMRLIFYGTKAWEFPLQDVNLTLTYPTAKPKPPSSSDSEEMEYIITGFKVILYIDGIKTRGYITDGGLLQEKLSLTFINSDITSLIYRFWLYGTTKEFADGIGLHSLHYMCS